MLNELSYKIYLRKTSNINLPKLCHNFYKFKFVNIKNGLPPPKGVLLRNFNQIVVPVGLKPTSAGLEAAAQSLYHGTKLKHIGTFYTYVHGG